MCDLLSSPRWPQSFLSTLCGEPEEMVSLEVSCAPVGVCDASSESEVKGHVTFEADHTNSMNFNLVLLGSAMV